MSLTYAASLMVLIRYGAEGETAATARNQEGGMFHLTDERVEGGYRAFVVAMPSMAILEGVWTWSDDGVHIAWSNGMERTYAWDGWHPNMPILRKIGAQQKLEGDK